MALALQPTQGGGGAHHDSIVVACRSKPPFQSLRLNHIMTQREGRTKEAPSRRGAQAAKEGGPRELRIIPGPQTQHRLIQCHRSICALKVSKQSSSADPLVSPLATTAPPILFACQIALLSHSFESFLFRTSCGQPRTLAKVASPPPRLEASNLDKEVRAICPD